MNTSESATGIERDVNPTSIAATHWKLTQVEFEDQTDAHNELVHEREWLLHPCEELRLQGNLFLLENTLTREGTIFLKRAPLPHARQVKKALDFVWDKSAVEFFADDYETVTLPYCGGRFGAMAALQKYQRQVRPVISGRDCLFLSNTWGDRSRDARVNEEFILLEIEAGAKLGVDVIQIDDGWQRGRTSNSAQKGGVWSGFWEADANFWDVHRERFPNGLKPLIEKARQHQMQFGLWFAPDSADDFANWQRDAHAILHLYRTWGINYFKIDGVKALSIKAEQNLKRFFSQVLEQSKQRVVFDLDVTAEVRPGYWGSMETGPLFVENRYTDWHRYWPHFTLRNLWKLAQWVAPARLRFEFLNNQRNQHLYADDPLAPIAYSPDYLFATVMFCCPLGWFEISNLPDSYFRQAASLIALWKRHRDSIFSGTIYSIGSPPDGTSWTGFISLAPDESQGYALIFRELNEVSTHQFPLPFAGNFDCEILAGHGEIRIADSMANAQIPEAQQFLFARFYR